MAAVSALTATGAAIVAGQGSEAKAPTGFDAAIIQPSKPEGQQIRIQIHIDPQRLTVENMPLNMLIARAFRIQQYQLKAPAWMSQESFDVRAETSVPVSQAQMLTLLQPYLVRQFGMTYHRASEDKPIYALRVGPDGIKAKASAPGAPGQAMLSMRNGAMHFAGSDTLARFAELLSNLLGRPVVDETRLSGAYDLDFSFSGGARGVFLGPKGGPPPVGRGSAATSSPPAGAPGTTTADANAADAPVPPLIEAVRQDLGLRLDATKGPISMLVIDRANGTPTGH